jgi:hypothetical protein
MKPRLYQLLAMLTPLALALLIVIDVLLLCGVRP